MDQENFSPEPKDTSEEVLISFTLTEPSSVSVEIYDLNGNICAIIPLRQYMAGEQRISQLIASLGIPAGKYVYYLQVENSEGTVRECKTLTIS